MKFRRKKRRSDNGKPVYRRDEEGADALRRLVQLEFGRVVEKRWLDCLRFCQGAFEVRIYPTDMLRSREVLPGFANPERAPATAIGFIASFSTVQFALPVGLDGRGQPANLTFQATQPQFHKIEWVTIVEPQEIERALLHVLKLAQFMLMQARMHATSKGSTATA